MRLDDFQVCSIRMVIIFSDIIIRSLLSVSNMNNPVELNENT